MWISALEVGVGHAERVVDLGDGVFGGLACSLVSGGEHLVEVGRVWSDVGASVAQRSE